MTVLLVRRDISLVISARLDLPACIVGSLFVTCLREQDPKWLYFASLVFRNFGQGIVYPVLLSTFVRASVMKVMYIPSHDDVCPN